MSLKFVIFSTIVGLIFQSINGLPVAMRDEK